MGVVIDFNKARGAREGAHAETRGQEPPRQVECANCGAKHPVVRLPGGELRYPTAFAEGRLWFCRHRGCRASWLSRHLPAES